MSAPPSLAACPAAATSVMLGVSFTMRGWSGAARRTAATTARITGGDTPKARPPFSVLGQDRLSSSAARPVAPLRRRDTATYSSCVSPNTLAMTTVPQPRSAGSFSARNASTPMFARPMALSIPDGVSQVRGGALPRRGRSDSPLVTNPPRSASLR